MAMKSVHTKVGSNLVAEQACKDANTALVLALVSIYASTIPLLGIVTALVAERLATITPDVDEIRSVRTKKNVVHNLTPFTLILSMVFMVLYYLAYQGKLGR